MRKRTNALKRRYQITLNNEERRSSKKDQYSEEKEVPSSNMEGKNELLETTLHHNYTKQPLE